MKKLSRFSVGKSLMKLAFGLVIISAFGSCAQEETQSSLIQDGKYVHTIPGNPYLPLWEHVPDGEPRVFEDPDNPGKYRAYIIGSHDVRFDSYCGPDIRMWSGPVTFE